MVQLHVRTLRRARLGVLVVALVGLGAGPASAATLAVNGSTLTYDAASGRVNLVGFTQVGSTNPDTVSVYRLQPSQFAPPGSPTDNDPITAGAGCTVVAAVAGPPSDPEHYDCTGVSAVVANLGDLADSATAATFTPAFDSTARGGLSAITITINGGQGAEGGLSGGGAADTIDGGPGNDGPISGGAGNDTIAGGVGNDIIDGGGGDDTVGGGSGIDTITDTGLQDLATPAAFTSNDTLNGDEGGDFISGGEGTDTVNGGEGDDGANAAGVIPCGYAGVPSCDIGLSGGDGGDTVNGGAGNDTVAADAPTASGAPVSDVYTGGPGSDTISYSTYASDVTVTLDGAANDGQAGEADGVSGDFENATGGAGNDTLVADALANVVDGGAGKDTLSGGAGGDQLNGNEGDDVVNGGDGSDTLGGNSGNDILSGDAGDDALQGGTGDDVFNGGAGSDTADYAPFAVFLTAGSLNVSLDGVANDGPAGELDNADADGQVENIVGGFGNDTLTGNAARNVLDGGPGNDTINGVDGTYLVDLVDCGQGTDSAAGDALDFIDRSTLGRCESVARAPITRVASETTLGVTPGRDRFAPLRFTARGRVSFGSVPRANGCRGTVLVRIKAGRTIVSSKRAKLGKACRYSSAATIRLPRRYNGVKRLVVTARFLGNRFVNDSSSPVRRPQAG